MEKYPIKQNSVSTGERISLAEYCKRKKGFFAAFLICAALLVAAFAASLIFGRGAYSWKAGRDTGETTDTPSLLESDTERASDTAGGSATSDLPSDLPSKEPEREPDGTIPILTLSLAAAECAEDHINNESIHTITRKDWEAGDTKVKIGTEPLVLIYHTHTSEGYLEEGERIPAGMLGTLTYTEDPAKSVVAVGDALCRALNGEGIPTIHCTTVHDKDGRMGAYEKAAESVRFFRSHYPSIMYVIDLHRDAVLTADGAYVRSLAMEGDTPLAQVMAVVGSDGNGTEHPNWRENLALAQGLRAALRRENPALCRPTVLRNASYNQELAPLSLLLEIGTGGNTVEEARASAALVGRALAALIRGN